MLACIAKAIVRVRKDKGRHGHAASNWLRASGVTGTNGNKLVAHGVRLDRILDGSEVMKERVGVKVFVRVR